MYLFNIHLYDVSTTAITTATTTTNINPSLDQCIMLFLFGIWMN